MYSAYKGTSITYLYHIRHFQDLAIDTLDNLYEFNREEAYSALTSMMPFHWGTYVTPLHVGEDAGAMKFMGHACCQTLLNRIWMLYMDLDTKWWKVSTCALHVSKYCIDVHDILFVIFVLYFSSNYRHYMQLYIFTSIRGYRSVNISRRSSNHNVFGRDGDLSDPLTQGCYGEVISGP